MESLLKGQFFKWEKIRGQKHFAHAQFDEAHEPVRREYGARRWIRFSHILRERWHRLAISGTAALPSPIAVKTSSSIATFNASVR